MVQMMVVVLWWIWGTRHIGIMCGNCWGESSPSSKLIKDGGVRVYISGAITTYKFIIRRTNILISYIIEGDMWKNYTDVTSTCHQIF